MTRIAIIGLGYVGLPLGVALARHGPTTGYDRDAGAHPRAPLPAATGPARSRPKPWPRARWR